MCSHLVRQTIQDALISIFKRFAFVPHFSISRVLFAKLWFNSIIYLFWLFQMTSIWFRCWIHYILIVAIFLSFSRFLSLSPPHTASLQIQFYYISSWCQLGVLDVGGWRRKARKTKAYHLNEFVSGGAQNGAKNNTFNLLVCVCVCVRRCVSMCGSDCWRNFRWHWQLSWILCGQRASGKKSI